MIEGSEIALGVEVGWELAAGGVAESEAIAGSVSWLSNDTPTATPAAAGRKNATAAPTTRNTDREDDRGTRTVLLIGSVNLLPFGTKYSDTPA